MGRDYGYSHGGISPQELITPYFLWERSAEITQGLQVTIQNKADLQSVTGELFQLIIKADNEPDDIFSLSRKVYLMFFSNNVQINKSEVFLIQKDQTISKEYTFDGNPEIDVLLLDAQTKEQLDRALVKQNKMRDLGGLL